MSDFAGRWVDVVTEPRDTLLNDSQVGMQGVGVKRHVATKENFSDARLNLK